MSSVFSKNSLVVNQTGVKDKCPRRGSNAQPTDSKNRCLESMPYMWGNGVHRLAYMGVKNVQDGYF